MLSVIQNPEYTHGMWLIMVAFYNSFILACIYMYISSYNRWSYCLLYGRDAAEGPNNLTKVIYHEAPVHCFCAFVMYDETIITWKWKYDFLISCFSLQFFHSSMLQFLSIIYVYIDLML